MAFNVSNVKMLTDEEHRIVMGSRDKLSIVFDDVRFAKRYDRYIVVNSDKQFGVVDLQGNVVIPIEYNKITTTNPAIFRVFGDYDQSRMASFGKCRYEAAFDYDGNQLFPFTSFTKILLIGNNGFVFGNEFPAKDAVNNLSPYSNSPMYLVNSEAKCLRIPEEYDWMAVNKQITSVVFLGNKMRGSRTAELSKAIHVTNGLDIVDLKDIASEILPLQKFIDTVSESYANEVKKNKKWNTGVDPAERLAEAITVIKASFDTENFKAVLIDNHWIVTDSNFNILSFLLAKNVKTIYNS